VKARKVNGLDPAGPLGDAAERIIRVRLDELCEFMPGALEDPVQLHDMRIAAKRLRYALEVTGEALGSYAGGTAIKHVKAVQEVLGEIHDCDEHLPEVRALLAETIAADAGAVGVDPVDLRRAPHRSAWAGLVALEVHLTGRRRALLEEFAELWESLERKGFRARLEYALTERSRTLHEGSSAADIMVGET
jgi:hypothetical protein